MDKNGFTSYLEGRGLVPKTIIGQIRYVEHFFEKTKKEDIQITKPDVLKYLEYLKKRMGLQNVTRKNHLIALNNYFTHLYQSEQTGTNPCLLLKIRGAARGNDRTLPLKATQIGLFINYLQNIRSQLLEYQTTESAKLFLPLPAVNYKTAKNEMTRNVFTPLAAQMKSIDKQFIDFTQIRASVITFWIKTQGLRKAQHLAGHRNISTTEKYIANDLENLTEDINKLHPF